MNDNSVPETFILKLRGLPYSATKQEVKDFLKGIEIKGGENGIHLVISPRTGRPIGEAFVECAAEKDYKEAFAFNKGHIGHRYVEIFPAKEDEFLEKTKTGVTSDTFVRLRGLPYTCTVSDVEAFFEGLQLKNGHDSIILMVENRGQARGDAFVQFSSPEEVQKAMLKNREKIKHRYIEIFPTTTEATTEARARIGVQKPKLKGPDISKIFSNKNGKPTFTSHDLSGQTLHREFHTFCRPAGFTNGYGVKSSGLESGLKMLRLLRRFVK